MRDYTQLTQEERYQIEALLKMGHCQSGIADALNRDKSTISGEARARPRIAPGTWERVESLLREDWSPEQISGWLSGEQGLRVNHEWVYQCVYADKRRGGDLHTHLRCQK